MPNPDLSSLKALIADDREDARRLLGDTLRGVGVTQIDTVPAALAGTRLVTLMARAAQTGGADTEVPAAVSPMELIARFSHDVASPLMCVIALSELLVHEKAVQGRTADDLRQVHEAAREIANLVRTLGIRAASNRAS